MSIKGFNNQKGLGTSDFASVVSAGSDKKAIPSLNMGVYEILPATAISAVSLSSDAKTVNIDFGAAHSARKGDILRMVSGTLPAWEFEVIAVVDSEELQVWNIAPSLPVAAETATILRPVSLQLDSSGFIPITPAAGGATEAKQDVQITELQQIEADVEAGNVLLTTISNIDFATEAKQDAQIVQETATNTKLDTLNAKDFATQTTLAALLTAFNAEDFASQTTLAALLTELQLKADLTETQPVSVASLPLPSGSATSANQAMEITELQDIEADVEAMSAKLPATIGQKAMAASLSVVIASDQAAIPVTSTSTPATVAGTITTTRLGVGLTAVRATVSGGAPNAARKKLMIKPSKGNTGNIYIGSSIVATTTGLEIIGPDRLEFDFDAGDYYVISDTVGQEVDILEKV